MPATDMPATDTPATATPATRPPADDLRPTDTPAATITIVPWPDPILDRVGHDPRSRYVERFWLPSLGPTALLLLRHLADRFDEDPAGLTLPVAATNQALGFGPRDGRSSPVVRQLDRLAQFLLTCSDGADTIAVRRHIPPINPKHVKRLPPALRDEHARWAEQQLEEGPLETARRRAFQLAQALVRQGDDDRVEHVLGAAGFHPAIAGEAARMALRDCTVPRPPAA